MKRTDRRAKTRKMPRKLLRFPLSWPATFLGALAISLMFVSGVCAQVTGRGSIVGLVTDPKENVVPKISVTVQNLDTGVVQTVISNATGYYQLDNLLAGRYQVTASAQGFKSLVRDGIVLAAEQTARVDLKLSVGAVTETVTVTSDAPLLNTSSGMSGQVTSNQMIQNDPTPGANTVLLLKFSRNVQTNDSSNLFINGSFNAAGANSRIGTAGQVSKNEFTLDGATDQNNSHQINYAPSNDEVNEMVTDTSGFDAQQGKTLGVSVALTTRGGTNAFHGSIKDLYENQRWNSLTHFARIALNSVYANCATQAQVVCDRNVRAAQQPHVHENNAGLTFGGPVWVPKVFDGRDKLFFFFSTSRDRFSGASPQSVNVPTAAERGGDFSDLATLNPTTSCTPQPYCAYTIYDPLTVRADPSQAGRYIRTAFKGNVVPTSRLVNPEIAFFNKEQPLPNNGTGPTGLNGLGNYTYTAVVPQLATSYTERIDYAFRTNDHFYVRASKFKYSQDTPDYTVDNIGRQIALMDVFVFAADWTHTFTSATVLDITAGYDRNVQGNQYPNTLALTAASVGLPGYLDAQSKSVDIQELPLTIFNGSTASPYQHIGTNTAPNPYFKVASLRAAFTHVQGRHSIKAGGEYRVQVSQAGGGGNAAGLINYDNTFVRQYSDTTGTPQQQGLDYAAFLLGIQTSSTLDINTRSTRSNPYYGIYVQDGWRITPKITVNAGIRFEYEFGPTEKNDKQITYFDRTQALPIAADTQAGYTASYAAYVAATPSGLPALSTTFTAQGGSIYAGVNGASRRAWENNQRFLPRLAINYLATPKTVIRGGYGLFYDTNNVLNISPDQSGFSQSTTDPSTNDGGIGLSGNFTSGNPYAGIAPITDPFPVNSATNARFTQPLGSSLGTSYETGNGWSYYPSNYVPAYQQRWQAAVERQLGSSMVLLAEYTGALTNRITLGHNLAYTPAAYYTGGNVLNPNTAKLNAAVSNPFYVSNYADLQTSNPSLYKNLIASRSFFTNKTVSYGSLLHAYPQQSSLTEQAPVGQSHFQEISVSCVRRMHKGLEYSINYQKNFAYDRDYYANGFDPWPSWEQSNNSRPSRFTVISVYELPFGKDRMWAASGWKSAVFGGFNLDGTYVLTNGPLLTFGNLIFNGDLSSIKRNGADYGHWFNTDGFDKVSADQLGAYNLRVFPTHVEGVRQVGENNVNLNLERTFSIKDKVKLQARYECFDVFNHGIITTINTTPTSSTFGQATGNDSGGPFNRAQQVQAKIFF